MLNVKRFAIAGGVVAALYVFVITWVAISSGRGMELLKVMEGFYPGYHVTAVGSVVGALYAFVDGFIKLGIVAWVYNKLESCVK